MTAPVGPQESYDITRLIQNPEIGLNVPAKRKFINPYSLPTLLKGLFLMMKLRYNSYKAEN